MKLIELLKVIVFGIIEGFTEWLPISSTAHLTLMDEFISLDASPEFREVFMTVIQFGAALAVMLLFYKRLNPLYRKKRPEQKAGTWRLWLKIGISSIPLAIVGLLLSDITEQYLSSGFVIGAMLVLYGILFILVEKIYRYREPFITRMGSIDYQTALYTGFIQVLAIVPGTSRFGIALLGAFILGFSRQTATEYSFFLGIPIIIGEGLLKLIQYGSAFSGAEIVYMVTGIIAAFFVSLYAIRFILSWIKNGDFKIFGYYRIALGVIVLIWYTISSLVD